MNWPKKITRLFILISFVSLGPTQAQTLQYPVSKEGTLVDNYHGIQIADPFRWLEEVDQAEVQSWMQQQDETLHQFLDNKMDLELIDAAISRFNQTGDNYSVPLKAGEHYYFNIWSPKADHAFIYRQRGLDGQRELLIDMNQVLESGETFNGFSVCPNGHFLAVLVKNGQASYGYLKLYNIDRKEWFEEQVDGVSSANVGWTYQNGFYYLDYGTSQQLNNKEATPHSVIKYHRLNSNPNQDLAVLVSPKGKDVPITLYSLNMSADHQHAVVRARQGRGDQNRLLLIAAADHKIHPLVEEPKYMFNYVGSKEDHFFFYTNKDAPNGKVIAIQKGKSEERNWQTVVAEQPEILAGGSTQGGNAMNFINDQFVLLYREGTQTQVKIFDVQGELKHQIPLETGWIGSGMVGVANASEAWITLNTFLSPSSVYRIDLKKGSCEVFFDRGLPIKRKDYIIENTYYESFDGTKVPIYICHKKGLKRGAANPVFMYGYGFGGWVATPWYQPHLLTFIEMGGIYVLPGVRGGGEFGDDWRDAGIKMNRQNAINDYIAAAEYLVEEGYSTNGSIVANGWSASGSLAAAASMQRPDLFGAGMIGIPSLDMLRYTQFTAFKGWTSSYGSPEVREEFLNLYKWSPYHNIKSNTCYPPMLITVGEKDPTTPPQHGYKFVAALQNRERNCSNPTLLKIVWGGGHGFGITSEQTKETQTQELAFLTKVLDLDVQSLARFIESK